jgi:hypothetical protein
MLPTPVTMAQALLGGRGGSELSPHGSGAEVVPQLRQTE